MPSTLEVSVLAPSWGGPPTKLFAEGLLAYVVGEVPAHYAPDLLGGLVVGDNAVGDLKIGGATQVLYPVHQLPGQALFGQLGSHGAVHGDHVAAVYERPRSPSTCTTPSDASPRAAAAA